MKTKIKPVVKFSTAMGTLAGEKYKHRYKRTLLATIKGPEAKALADSSEYGSFWSYDDKKQILQIWKEELVH
jgi:hypothetical protein